MRKERWKIEATGEDLYLIDQAVKSVAMQMHISEAEDRIWSLCGAYSQALITAGYGDVIQTKLQIAINHFLKKLKPFQLHCKMLYMITWMKDENFHKENFDRFVKKVAFQAKTIQSELRTMLIQERSLLRDSFANKKPVHTVKSQPNQADSGHC